MFNLLVHLTHFNSRTTTEKKIDDYYLKIQIASSKNRIPLKSYNFKGLKGLSRSKSGNIFRYYFENTSSYSQAKQFLSMAKKSGFKDAIIVGFKNGNRISIKDYLSSVKK